MKAFLNSFDNCLVNGQTSVTKILECFESRLGDSLLRIINACVYFRIRFPLIFCLILVKL